MQHGLEHGDGLLSRSETEIELARLVLAVTRRRESEGEAPGQAFTKWFETVAVDLLGRVAPDLRPFVLERLQQIARSNGDLQIVELDVDATTLTFGPATDDSEPTDASA